MLINTVPRPAALRPGSRGAAPRPWRSRSATALLALALCAGTAAGAAAPAAAASTTFDFPARPRADQYHDIPGTQITFTAEAGQKSYLWSRHLSVSNVTPLVSGENIGNTFAIRCRYADGAPLANGAESGAYWAANLVPPGETSLSPGVRWLFTAPTSATYSCRLSVVAYSSVVAGGKNVTMRVPAGAELARTTPPVAARWTLQSADATVVPSGSEATTLGYTFSPAGGDRIAVVQDAALSTCAPGSPICAGGTEEYDGTEAETWIEAQPRNPDGALCGGPVKGPVGKWRISDAKHHQTATNTLYLDTAQLGGCTQVRVTLKVRNVHGNPVNIHAGHASEWIAATRGTAFTY
ncbi:hypothetical protein [Streptomyces sp. CC228A]|uniref:hypothetical protein n=1 Tax=Streptomyces sp. CC228A TaxID=2898186 RepID=UPI001F3DC7C4|nr:hypothetical protein [Streptomyces sp. CC228A]